MIEYAFCNTCNERIVPMGQPDFFFVIIRHFTEQHEPLAEEMVAILSSMQDKIVDIDLPNKLIRCKHCKKIMVEKEDDFIVASQQIGQHLFEAHPQFANQVKEVTKKFFTVRPEYPEDQTRYYN